MRVLLAGLALAVATVAATGPVLSAAPAAAAPLPAAAATGLPKVGHVWVVVLENKTYAQSFSPLSKAPYLETLARSGALLEQYYGVAHYSLPNYLALLSGQGPNPVTQSDCQVFAPFVTTGTPVGGQFPGQGCVFPASVSSLASQLSDKGTPWKGYMEDLGASTTRQTGPCGLPKTDALMRDLSQTASATDQYAAR
ncbi:MAG: alkaline phosphatase family protein, partial [Nocardioides sp.]